MYVIEFQCNRKITMNVSEITIAAEGLGKFFEFSGKNSARADEKLEKN